MGSFMSDLNIFGRPGSTGQIEEIESYFTSVSFWLEIALMIVFYTVASVMNIATVNNYLLIYGEKRSNVIEVSEVWTRVRETFWMYFRSMFLFILLLVASYIVLMIPMFVLVAISPFLMFFGILFFLVALVYLIFAASLTFIIRAYEKNGFFEAVVRSFKLVKNKWWSTFGLLMILYLIMAVASYIFVFPWYIISGISMAHNLSSNSFEEPSSSWQLITTVVFAVYYLIQMFLAALPNIGAAFQYFNLVELKEAKGLMSQIETLGQPVTSSPAQDEHY
jgi:hypothetical protein